MNLSEDLQNRLDKYISGAMNESDALKFEEEIEGDEELKREYNLQKNLSLGIAVHANEALKSKLEKIHNDVVSSPSSSGKSSSLQWRYLAIAASVSILIISYFLISSNKNSLYSKYYEAPTFSIQRGSSTNNLLDQAGLNFNNKKYKQAADNFKTYLIDYPNDQNARFYLGITYLELEDYDNAIVALDKVVSSDDPLMKDQSLWYLALAHLTRDKSKARLLLGNLSQDQHSGKWQKMAKNLLEELK